MSMFSASLRIQKCYRQRKDKGTTLDTPIPDLRWYIEISRERGASPRCPFATSERCPRYFQSLSLLGEAGSTKIEPDEDERLFQAWKRTDLWPKTAEYETSLFGPVGEEKHFANFCPEVAHDRFGYFASFLGRYADELDSGPAHDRLYRDKVPKEDPRWAWSSISPMHYTECPLYSPLLQPTTSRLSREEETVTSEPNVDPRKVMVIHGRNVALRDAIFEFLRALDLDPIEWEQAVRATGSPSPQILDVVNKAFELAKAVVVLMTGDDLAKLKPELLSEDDEYEKALTPQPRANVIFEAGMAFALHRNRTVLVTIGNIRSFSDIGGVHAVKLNNDPQKRNDLAGRLESAGCVVNRTGSDWYRAGDFSDVSAGGVMSQNEINTKHANDFSNEETIILQHLFDHGESSVVSISKSTGMPTHKVQIFINELIARKFISQTRSGDFLTEMHFVIRGGRVHLLRGKGVIG